MKVLLSSLPGWARAPLRYAGKIVKALPYYGRGRCCPVCGKSSRRFRPFGVVLRKDAQCIHCGALERHRLLWLFLQGNTDLFDGKARKMLHVAPEPCFEKLFMKHLGENYLTADLFNARAMVKMDICDIQYPDESFDVIYCSHVLEHVPDDRQAMREFYRVLKNTGWAILNVPVNSDRTFEDPSIVLPEDRLKAFGQEDHVRRYGPDYIDRLRESGFTVRAVKPGDLASDDEIVRMGLVKASGEIYYCTKQ